MASNFERTVYIIELRDKVSMGMNRATAATSRFNRGMVTARTNTNLLGGAMRGLAIGALAGVAYGIGRVTTQIIKMAAELESTTIAFEVMLRSATKAQSLVTYGKEFARVTPFTQRQVFGNMRQLLAYGAPESKIREYNRMLSTIAAGVGQERLPFLTLAMGQVIAKGRLQGQELRQFTEHGVPVVAGLADLLGISTAEVYETMRKGLITSQQVVDVMMAMTAEGGLFEGMLERLRESFTGTMNVMKSTWQLALVEAIDPLMISMKAWMEEAIKLVAIVPEVTGGFYSLGEAISNVLTPVTDLTDIITKWFGGDKMSAAIFGFKYAQTLLTNTYVVLEIALYAALTPLRMIVAVIQDWRFAMIDLLMQLNPFIRGRGGSEAYGNIWAGAPPPVQRGTTIGFGKRKFPGLNLAPLPLLGLDLPLSLVDRMDIAETTAKKERVANRLIGTGARDIVIHIGNLIENMSIATPSIGESADQLTERVTMAMLTAINDASILADR